MTTVCITGMHRSGTSMIARGLNICGIYLGEEKDIYPGNKDNPEGYWENSSFVNLNETILFSLKGGWDIPPNFVSGWENSEEIKPYYDIAKKTIKNVSTHTHWGWKDPRTSLLLPFWKKMLPDLKVIVCIRNPYEVAQSLARRGYSSTAFSINLWNTYYESLLASLSDKDYIVTHYESFFYDGSTELRRLLSYLSMPIDNSKIEIASNTINAAIRHNLATYIELEKIVPIETVALYKKLCSKAGGVFYDHSTMEIDGRNRRKNKIGSDYKNEGTGNNHNSFDLDLMHQEKSLEMNIRDPRHFHKGGNQPIRSKTRLEMFLNKLKVVLLYDGPRGVYLRISNRFKRKFLSHLQQKWLKLLVDFRQSRFFTESVKFIDHYTNTLLPSLNTIKDEYVPISEDDFNGNAKVKLVAFYLPQFHPIPENNEWWGRGFTEWTNVSKAIPQFLGHYQPHLPDELGFYDLRIPEVQYRQIELARKYGIFGFCFYYYWFNGKRLLEQPLDQFINDSENSFPFSICWANENWTRRWDGQEDEILIDQKHSVESDMDFIQDIVPLLRHKNYICINDRPILIVYRANVLPDPAGTAKRWKDYCQSIGMKEPYLIAAQTHFFNNPTNIGFDAAVQFPPHNKTLASINHKLEILNPNYDGHVVDYKDAWPILSKLSKNHHYKLFRTVFPGWDNEPRRPGKGYTFAFSTPQEYRKWLEDAMNDTFKENSKEERIVFINAWNEWAEGAHLEPDRRFGYAYLQATLDALNSIQQPE